MMTLASCSGKNKTADKAPAKQTVGLPNPIHESSAEEIAEKLQSEEKDSKENVTIKQDLSFIYENNKKQEKNNKKKKGKK